MTSHWDVTPDSSRSERLGFDETIYCLSKSVDQVERIVSDAAEAQSRLLLTRLNEDKFDALPAELRSIVDFDPVSGTGILGEMPASTATRVAVVSGGTSDVPVAREAARTLAYYGHGCIEIYDVGVAGIWRLMDRVEEIRAMPVVITVAGMEGTLPTVIGGLVPGVVIAIPASTGYGVGAGGMAALNSALASCAPGLVVVNIDNGYGAACAALRFLNMGENDPAILSPSEQGANEATGEGPGQ